MRVAILSQFPPHALGAFRAAGEPRTHYATWLPQIAAEMEKQIRDGDSLHWILLNPNVSERKDVREFGQTFHVLPTATSGRAASLFRADRAAIANVLREIQPNLVHGWGNEDVFGLAAATSGFRNIVCVQGLLSEYALHNRLPARTYLQLLIELFVLNRADQVVCESLWARDMTARRIFRRKAPIRHIEYGVQPGFYAVPWEPDPKTPVAVCTGSVDPRKGVHDLVAAFSTPELSRHQLWVLGGDQTPFAQRLKADAPPNIHWFGRLPMRESIERLRKAWCFVLPTRCDTGPMALKEARVVGLPAISSPHSGARDYIEEGKNGYLVRPGDIRTLTDRLQSLLSDLELCRRMGAWNHESARAEFHPTRTAADFLGLYREMAGRPPVGAKRS